MISRAGHALEDAAANLREQTRRRCGEMVALFKEFRKVEEDRLRELLREGGGGRETARMRSDMVDVLLKELFSIVASQHAPGGLPEALAVAACGGYGRSELSPFSDIDVIFLHRRPTMHPVTEECVREIVTALWDIGFKVGHATRSIRDAIRQANADPVTKTALLESRFLAGDREVFKAFRRQFEHDCVSGREAAYIAWRLADQARLHAKYGGSVFMQEPHIKNGVGGLRDFQNLLWLAYFKDRIATPARLVVRRILSEDERHRLDQARDFLLRIRAEMQYLAGRASDVLTLQIQGRVATVLGYPQKHILRRVEAFMREFYTHAREIHLITSAAIERLRLRPEEAPKARLLGILKPRKTERFDGFIARGGRLLIESPKTLVSDEFRILRAFHHAQTRRLELDGKLRDGIRSALPQVNRTFQYARSSRETFLAILSRKGEVGRTLREMHDLGFLGLYLPEFGALTCLVQHEFYHRYTADEHTLVCIEKLDGVLFSEEGRLRGYRDLFQQLEDPAILYLALLLHDTGKAANTRHHEDASATLAQKVARRFQLSPERRRMLITLVNSHSELSLTARKRNLDDAETITQFAAIIRTQANLDALMLLTLADGMGTTNENWSDWKEGLIWTLYGKTSHFLQNGRIASEPPGRGIQVLRDEVVRQLPKDFEGEIAAHFDQMPARYWQMFEAGAIVGHLRLFRAFLENHLRSEAGALTPALDWIGHPERGHSEVCVCGWDRPRLLERIAGAFLSCHINILSADIFTRGDNLALDCFRVCTTALEPVTNAKSIARVESRLTESLRVEDYDFLPLISRDSRLRAYRISQEADLPTKIAISNTERSDYTLVDIQTPDRLGLLYDLLRALGAAGVNIELSRITTELDVAIDSFYITGKDGGQVSDPAALRRIQRLLQKACSQPRE